MLHRVRGVRFLVLLASVISIAGGLFAATRACAAPTDSLATNPFQARRDSIAASQAQKPAPATSIPVTTQPVMPPITTPSNTTPRYTTVAAKAPKPKANSIHLYGGLFAPTETNAPSPTIGVRLGRRLGGHLQGGLLVDWTFERKNVTQPINGLPGLQPQLILARADGSLVPMSLFLEVSLTEKRFLVPYGGIAGGYEWLFLTANDYVAGTTASATYTNFAWQGWGGVGIRLDPGLRVDVELSYNGGSLERDAPGFTGLREAVRVNGVGARVGLDMSY